MITIIVAIVVLASATAYALVHEERPVLFPEPTFAELMAQIGGQFRQAAVIIGEALTPALRQATEAINQFAEAMKKGSQDANA